MCVCRALHLFFITGLNISYNFSAIRFKTTVCCYYLISYYTFTLLNFVELVGNNIKFPKDSPVRIYHCFIISHVSSLAVFVKAMERIQPHLARCSEYVDINHPLGEYRAWCDLLIIITLSSAAFVWLLRRRWLIF